MNQSDWSQGGDAVHYQQCRQCGGLWYFQRSFCPRCGAGAPELRRTTGRGRVQARTLVQRAPTEEFRAIVPYLLVLVEMEEGFRMMGHAAHDLAMDDAVVCEVRSIAGRQLPFFLQDPNAT